VAGTVVLLAAGLSLPLANRLVRPIKALADGTRQLSAGRFGARVPVTSADELGQLARDFNSLALTLEKNEEERCKWVADISHELRTPLSVLRGEIEALQDGIHRPTPEAIASLHGETLRLGRLVEDLYQLSLSDLGALTYKKRELDCAPILRQALESFQPDFSAKGIALRAELGDGTAHPLFADGERLRQLFGNLLENSLKYTDSNGELFVRLEYADNRAVIHFRTAPPAYRRSPWDIASSGCPGARRRATGRPAGPGWDWRSAAISWRPTTGPSRRRIRRSAGCGSR
jgi:two-component system sensor histidine kinase BaeS